MVDIRRQSRTPKGPDIKPLNPFTTGVRHGFTRDTPTGLASGIANRSKIEGDVMSQAEFNESIYAKAGLDYREGSTDADYQDALAYRDAENHLDKVKEEWGFWDVTGYWAGRFGAQLAEPTNYLGIGLAARATSLSLKGASAASKAVGARQTGAKLVNKAEQIAANPENMSTYSKMGSWGAIAAVPDVVAHPFRVQAYEELQTGESATFDTLTGVGMSFAFGAGLAGTAPWMKRRAQSIFGLEESAEGVQSAANHRETIDRLNALKGQEAEDIVSVVRAVKDEGGNVQDVLGAVKGNPKAEAMLRGLAFKFREEKVGKQLGLEMHKAGYGLSEAEVLRFSTVSQQAADDAVQAEPAPEVKLTAEEKINNLDVDNQSRVTILRNLSEEKFNETGDADTYRAELGEIYKDVLDEAEIDSIATKPEAPAPRPEVDIEAETRALDDLEGDDLADFLLKGDIEENISTFLDEVPVITKKEKKAYKNLLKSEGPDAVVEKAIQRPKAEFDEIMRVTKIPEVDYDEAKMRIEEPDNWQKSQDNTVINRINANEPVDIHDVIKVLPQLRAQESAARATDDIEGQLDDFIEGAGDEDDIGDILDNFIEAEDVEPPEPMRVTLTNGKSVTLDQAEEIMAKAEAEMQEIGKRLDAEAEAKPTPLEDQDVINPAASEAIAKTKSDWDAYANCRITFG